MGQTAGGRLTRRRLLLLGLVAAAAAVLSGATILAISRTVASQAAPGRAEPAAPVLGFVRMDKPAPPVRLPNLTGHGTVSLAGLAGRPIVVNFWASTCEVCKSETPAVASVARGLGGRVAFVGIDTLDLRGAARAFVARYRVPYPIAFDPQGTAASSYGVPGLPVTFFLSPSARTILGENIGALTAGRLRAILRTLYRIG